jgi:hypothetical protein
MDITASALPVTPTNTLVNRPIVASGSTVAGGQSLTQAWYQGEAVQYVDFGPNQDTTSTVYVLITGLDAQGNPLPVSGQGSIFTTIPGQLEYSAFCVVNLVTVPADYAPNTLTSAADVLAAGYPVNTLAMPVNYPIISPVFTPTPTPSAVPSPSTSAATSPSPSPTEIPSPSISPSP